MPDPEWTVLVEAGRARILETPVESGRQGEPPRLVEELADAHAAPVPGQARTAEELERFARQVVARLKQAYADARFEYLRIAAEPRLLGALRKEIDKHLDLHRAVLEWRELNVVPVEAGGAAGAP
ncbi:host attachment protein [Ramlibacter ginsenosidimutans]|uniref:Host attachment protein n=1 Tax=Ramlibacter ginsenosidimutans TaxID=502333 RepID=A0A934TP41_9BURK|nr:host attachment protein [Ramlibacter ginsenosidimutans]MBK6004783.1 host attachment protein [Ramlibacter ginsenosidimutans]